MDYEVVPRIVRADEESEVTIRPRFEHAAFREGVPYRVFCLPMEGFGDGAEGARIEALVRDGVLRFKHVFEGEQEHSLIVEAADESGKSRRLFRVYSLEADLYATRPYKGDLHIHSCRSDGRESPAYVAGASRRIGLDFMAVTDHRRYEPSIEAQEAFADCPHDLAIYRGEEVHPPDNPVHIINFGGRFSINARFDTPEYRRDVERLMDRIGTLPRGVDAYQYASTVWCFDKIREAGGLGLFCHPYWVTGDRYSPSGPLTSHIFDTAPYDAFELIGGFHRHEVESNVLQCARYHEERARGRVIPVVGVSDAHGCERGELFGWYYTIVFAPSVELDDLIAAIKDGLSVAVEALPGETPRAHGPFRLVKYAHFLLREVFPRHDALCYEEGRLMLDYLAGMPDARDTLAQFSGRCTCWMESQHR